MITQEQLAKAKTKVHFKQWVTKVRANNMAYKLPDDLINKLDPSLDAYVISALTELGLTQVNGYWERT